MSLPWVILTATILSLGAAPLTPEQQSQLQTAKDFSRVFDEGALYPLLQNALAWEQTSEAGAMVPDYAALRAEPGRYRGELFLIEGEYATIHGDTGSGRKVKLSRPGPWDDRLVQWPIVVDDKDHVVLVYLVTPPTEPRLRQPVRVPARFYKVWSSTNVRGETVDYLAFVGQGAKIIGGASPSRLGKGFNLPLTVLIILTGLAVLYIFVIRRRIVGRLREPGWAARAASKDEEETHRPDIIEDDGPPLPDDPAQALEELQRRRKDRTSSGP